MTKSLIILFLVAFIMLAGYAWSRNYNPFQNVEIGNRMFKEENQGSGSDAAAAPPRTESTAAVPVIPEEGFTIDISALPPAQQSALQVLGYEDTIVFTPEMLSCAEEKIGQSRVAEVIAGASPTVIESSKLLPCL